jgi:hypothetical protein
MQTDFNGDELWTEYVGNGGWEELSCATVDENGQMWFGGFSYIGTTQLYDHLLVTTSGLLKNQKATVEELDYRQGNLITVLTLNDFAHLYRIKQQLQKEPSIDVKLKQSGARGNKVQVRFVISRVAT